MDTTAKNLVEFLDKAGTTGRIKPDMAGQLSSTARMILGIEQDWEEIDVAHLDTEGLLARFKNLKGLEYAPRSLTEYERRFRRSIKMFLDYVQNPSGWKHNGQARQNKKTGTQKATTKQEHKARQVAQGETIETSNVAINPAGIQMMEYPFPLRESCIVRLRLPADLNVTEVERLATFMRSVVVDSSK